MTVSKVKLNKPNAIEIGVLEPDKKYAINGQKMDVTESYIQ